MNRRLKTHYYQYPNKWGCPVADGHIQQSDTDSTSNWNKVTCKICLRLRKYRYSERKR